MKLENDGFVLITIFCDGFASWWDEFTVSFLLHNVKMYLLGVFFDLSSPWVLSRKWFLYVGICNYYCLARLLPIIAFLLLRFELLLGSWYPI